MKKETKTKEHEHRYYPNSRQKSDTCIICGFNPHFENYGRKYTKAT